MTGEEAGGGPRGAARGRGPGSGTLHVITGASSGIGKAAARGLAERGDRVAMVCRDRGRGEAAREEILEAAPGSEVELLLADLSSQAQVRGLAERIPASYDRLGSLIHNAGVYTRERRTTEDGLEYQLAVNYLAPFLLTNLLLPFLEESAPARVVVVASMEHRIGRIDFDDLQLESNYRGTRAYRQSKLAAVLFTRELARRTEGSGLTANALHPGVVYTKLVRRINSLSRLVKWILKSPAEGAEGIIHLATSEEVRGVTGRYYRGTRPVRPARRARDPEKARRLWSVSEELTGLS